MSKWIFSHKCILYKVFNNFFLPDVASAVIPLLHIISLVASISVIVSEDDEPNKVEYVLIDIFGKFTETMH